MNIQQDFQELLKLLEKHGVEYMIVGGYADAFYKYPRFTKDLDGVLVRVVKAVYLAAIALKAGRAKDKTRILALLEANATTTEEIENVAMKHGLTKEWKHFKETLLDGN